MLRLILGILMAIFIATTAIAKPVRYVLEADKSSVGFTYQFNGKPTKGTMPVASADLLIDLGNISATKVTVTLNVRKARAGFIFATEALRSGKVLDARSHPKIRFVSTRVRRVDGGAQIDGMATMRGVTRPMTLLARFFRQQGSEAGDHSRLSIVLTGSVQRSEFGASGYPDLVGDRIDLRIIARIKLAN